MSEMESYGLKLDIQSTEAQVAADKVRALETELKLLNSAVEGGSMRWDQARQRIASVTTELDRMRAVAVTATSAVNAAAMGATFQGGTQAASLKTQQYIAAQGFAPAGGRSADNRMGAAAAMTLNLGAMAEDAQYGFGAIANQLPLLGMQLAQVAGKSGAAGMVLGGLVGIITAMGTTAYRTSTMFRDFIDDFGKTLVTIKNWAWTPSQTREQAATDKAQLTTKEDLAKDAAAAIAAARGMDSSSQAQAEEFKRAVKEFGGNALADIVAKSGQGVQLGKAMQGDSSAIAAIDALMRGDGANAGKWANARQARDPLQEMLIDVRAERRQQEMLANARTAEDFNSVINELHASFKLGNISIDQFRQGLDQVDAAAKKAAESEKQLAEQQVKRQADREASREMERINREEGTLDRRSGKFADIYSQAFGGNMAQAMLMRAGKGESFDDAEKAMKDQLEKRLVNIQDPAMRSRIAADVAGRSRLMAEDQAIGMTAMGDIRGNAMAANLARAGTTQRAMQEQAAARMGVNLKPYDDASKSAGETSSRELRAASKEFAQAVKDLQSRGLVVTL